MAQNSLRQGEISSWVPLKNTRDLDWKGWINWISFISFSKDPCRVVLQLWTEHVLQCNSTMYRVFHLLRDLGWVELDFDVPLCYLATQPLLPNSHQPKHNCADSGTPKMQVNPNLGWVDLDLGSSPGWWVATVASYCPSRMVENPKSKSSQPMS